MGNAGVITITYVSTGPMKPDEPEPPIPEMVKRVARVIGPKLYQAFAEGFDGMGVQESNYDDLSKVWRESAVEMARAAIQAIREPTLEMVSAGEDTGSQNLDDCWREMIDEALK